MINDINLDYFKIFYTVAICKNLTKASEVLYISQPAITQTIKKLEEKLKVTLFIRTKKGVILTPEGNEIYNQVKQAYFHLNNISQIVDDINALNNGTLNIGCGSNMSIKILLKPIIEFSKKYPNVICSQIDKPQNVILEELSNCNIDLCISQYNANLVDKFDFLPILSEEFIFVCSPKYFDSLKSDLPRFIVQGDGTYNKTIFDNYINKNNISDFKQFISVGYNFAIELCLNNYGISLVPKYLVEKHLKSKTLQIFDQNISENITYGIYTTKNLQSKKVQTFLEFVLKFTK